RTARVEFTTSSCMSTPRLAMSRASACALSMRSARVASSRRTRSSINGTRISNASTINRARMLTRGFGAGAADLSDVGLLGIKAFSPTPHVDYGERDEGGFLALAKIGTIVRISIFTVGNGTRFALKTGMKQKS